MSKASNRFSQFIWKIRAAYYARRLCYLPLSECWGYAGAWLENINFDTTECTPKEAAEAELDEWRQCV